MKISKYFWNYNTKSIKKVKDVLNNPYHPDFVQRIYSILSATQNTKEVFSIIGKTAFKEKWPEIRRYWTIRNQAMDYKAWWETIYEMLVSNKKSTKKLAGRPAGLFKKIGSLIRKKRIEKTICGTRYLDTLNINSV